MTAAEWVIPPGETETDSVETVAEIVTRLTGRTMPGEEDDEGCEEQNSNLNQTHWMKPRKAH